MQTVFKKISVHRSCNHATSSSVLKFITFINSENDLDIFDKKMNEKMSSDVFLTSELLLDSSHTSKNRSTVSQVLYVSMLLLILFQLTVKISDRNACVIKTLVKVMCIKCMQMLHSKNITSQCNAVFHNKMMYYKCERCVDKETTCILVSILIRCID